jgi:hypothetical protein
MSRLFFGRYGPDLHYAGAAPHLGSFVELRDRETVMLLSKTIFELENIRPRI